jgi:transposase-like protein
LICYPHKRQRKRKTVFYGGIVMSKRRKIKSEDKIRTARACANGTISLNAAAEQMGVHPSVVDD